MCKRTLLVSMVLALVFTVPVFSTPAESAEWELDNGHKNLVVAINHINVSDVYGFFLDWEASAQYDPDNPGNTSLSVTIQSNSFFTGIRDRDDHIKSPDFLNAGEYPEITFESTGVRVVNSDDYDLAITGDFTLRGTTREITIPLELTGRGEGPQGNFRQGFRAEFSIDRTEYGVDFMPDMLGHEVEIIMAGEMIRQ